MRAVVCDLSIFDPDPARAEARYHELRRDLIRFLEWKGCPDPEETADEAVLRGWRRLAEGVDTSAAGPRAYFFGIVKNLRFEHLKKRARERQLDAAQWELTPSASRDHKQVEAKLTLTKALGRLSEDERELIVKYYSGEDRLALCAALGLRPGNLRVIIHRIKLRIALPCWRPPQLSYTGDR